MSETAIAQRFGRVFAHKDDELIDHYISQFTRNNRKDFGSYFFSCEVTIIRELFEYHGMEMEPDKYDDDIDLFKANMREKNKFKVYPFEYMVTRLFYLMAGNNSLELLEDISSEGFDKVKSQDLDLYGNGVNWSNAWNVLDDAEKEKLVYYLLNDFKG